MSVGGGSEEGRRASKNSLARRFPTSSIALICSFDQSGGGRLVGGGGGGRRGTDHRARRFGLSRREYPTSDESHYIDYAYPLDEYLIVNEDCETHMQTKTPKDQLAHLGSSSPQSAHTLFPSSTLKSCILCAFLIFAANLSSSETKGPAMLVTSSVMRRSCSQRESGSLPVGVEEGRWEEEEGGRESVGVELPAETTRLVDLLDTELAADASDSESVASRDALRGGMAPVGGAGAAVSDLSSRGTFLPRLPPSPPKDARRESGGPIHAGRRFER